MKICLTLSHPFSLSWSILCAVPANLFLFGLNCAILVATALSLPRISTSKFQSFAVSSDSQASARISAILGSFDCAQGALQ